MADTRHSSPARDKASRRLRPGKAALAGLIGLIACAAQASPGASIPVNAVVLSKNICKFNASTAALNFGTINVASDSAVLATASLSLACNGSDKSAWFSITQSGGLHRGGTGTNRMKHASSAEYLPYSLQITPGSGNALKRETVTVTVQGSIQPAHFQNVLPGSYSDTVVLTLEP